MVLESALLVSTKVLTLGMDQDFEYVKTKIAAKGNRGGSWDNLAKAADVNYHWLTKFHQGRASGYSKAGIAQIRKLAAYFRQQEA